MSGWETHSDRFEGTPRQAAVLDQAMSALLADLQAKGLLDQMLVVLGTEFGYTPRINDNDGRVTTPTERWTPTATTSRGSHLRRRS